MSGKILGIMGCGNIGGALAAAAGDMSCNIEKIILWDIDTSKVEGLEKSLPNAKAANSVLELVELSDIIAEAVSPSVVKDILERVITAGKDILIMSVGGILGNERLLYEAGSRGIRVILPSGAVSGIDALKAASVAGIDTVTITTRKPVRSIKGAPYFEERGIDTGAITEETTVFEGNAVSAIKAFPKNINVSALLSIAGIGAQKTMVKIVVSPEYTKNSHEVVIKGRSGTITTLTENVPSPENPKTSYLAVLSAIAALKGYFDPVQIGT
ncbi:MAG: DUF108 domain-containing protein [Candidatus Omnitrophica bacterium]|nr:DUF108 domain-containing protein [Candidatus Omnitrophota bacterium]MBU1127732.1 DUF108 domain-containing protein [Candidatus Omnitrophota bacterium]MBU1784086.1 DUF108 domain-containing protein [Candidatus Omnitrophota bacterium]MBU1852121.1 DUF108 domain-containing protein [Candidatus Omnitrophota bacterium]